MASLRDHTLETVDNDFTPLPNFANTQEEVNIYLRRSIRIWNVSVITIFLCFCLYLGIFPFIMMACMLLPFTWRNFFDFKPMLKINAESFMIRRRLYYWHEVTGFDLKTSKDPETETKLVVQLLDKKKSIGVDGLTKTPEEIKKVFDAYKKLSAT